jgi:tRNA A22 N-methylase
MDILRVNPTRYQPVVIQAMKSWPELRIFLAVEGYAVCEETLAVDRGRPYVAALYRHVGSRQPLSLLESWIGPVLLRKRPAGWNLYLDTLLRHLQKKCRSDPDLQALVKQIKDLKSGDF